MSQETAWRLTSANYTIDPQLDEAGRELPGLGSSTFKGQLMSGGAVYEISVKADIVMSNFNLVNALSAAASHISVLTGGEPMTGARIAGSGENTRSALNG